MATRIARANNTFNTAATWGLVDSTSLLDTETGTSEPGTSYTASANFTPGAIEIDGIAVKLAVNGTGDYTVSCQLYNATDSVAVAGTEVTINRTDLCSATSAVEGGWVLFAFSAVTLEAAHNYNVQLKLSNAAANVTFYRNGTANNWARMLRTTTTGAPGAADILHIMEEKTGAGAATARTVTMDQLAAAYVDLGSGTDGSIALGISDGGTLLWANTAATNYYLKCSGNIIIFNGGTFNLPAMPRDSTAVIEFDPVADGGMGMIARSGATLTLQGLSRTTGKNVVYCKLNTDEAVNSTSLGVDTDTGWLDNDEIAIASTSRTATERESGTLNGAAGAATLTVDGFAGVGGGLANAHKGTINANPQLSVQAEIILLTRNVKFRSATSTIMTYLSIKLETVVDIDWVEFRYLGEAATDKRGINIETTTGSCNIQYCAFRDFEDNGIYIVNSATNNFVISNNVGFNLAQAAGSGIMTATALTNADWTISTNVLINCAASASTYQIGNFSFVSLAGTITNNIATSSGNYGFSILQVLAAGITVGTFSGNLVHSVASNGFYFFGTAGLPSTFATCTAYYCNSFGFSFPGTSTMRQVRFTDLVAFGNSSPNVYFYGGTGTLTFDDPILDSDATYTTTTNIIIANNVKVIINNGLFSTNTAATNDIQIYAYGVECDVTMYNTTLAAGVEVLTPQYLSSDPYTKIASINHDAGATTKTWRGHGIITLDTEVFNTASPSERLTLDTTAAYVATKLISSIKKVNVNSGEACTPSVYVQLDATYDNTYPVRLMVRENQQAGITSDTQLDSTTTEGSWVQLTGATAAVAADCVLEFYVDCSGSAGFINVDDWTATVA